MNNNNNNNIIVVLSIIIIMSIGILLGMAIENSKPKIIITDYPIEPYKIVLLKKGKEIYKVYYYK
jgi:hypothetical protein